MPNGSPISQWNMGRVSKVCQGYRTRDRYWLPQLYARQLAKVSNTTLAIPFLKNSNKWEWLLAFHGKWRRKPLNFASEKKQEIIGYQKVQNAIFYSNKHAYKSAIQIFDAVQFFICKQSTALFHAVNHQLQTFSVHIWAEKWSLIIAYSTDLWGARQKDNRFVQKRLGAMHTLTLPSI